MSRKGRMVKGSLRRVAVTVISGIIFLAVFSTNLFSQIERANELYNSLEYSKAIPLYIKALKKEENIEAVRNLAHCYFITHDYHQAEIFYEKAIKLGDTSPEVQINYGRVLKNNRKYDEAKEVFVVYAGKNPDDLKGKAYAVSVDKLKTWKEDEPVFEVSSMAEINSPVADFSPVMYRNGIAFTSEREKDNVTDLVYGLNNRPYLSVFLSELKKDSTLDAPKLFKGKINGDYHNGPVSFNNDFSLAVFTRVMNLKRGKEFTNRPQLFIADSDKNKWKKAVPFEHNSSEYSLAHPAISPDGNLLVFVSDMPGGFGGKDLFVSHKTATGWSKPENLGAEINTFGNEMFPSFGKDGTLFFSSDGHVGYGGLDIFSSKKEDNTWGKPENLKEPLNSSTDDFGITFTDAKNGYFSSNRPGGLGDDDIYKFKIIREKKESTKITGVFLYSKLKPGANVSIALLDENDNEIQVVKTNEKGEFVFDKLKPEMNYVVRIKEEDARITDQSVVYITNSNGEAVEQMVQPKKGYFVFHSLPSERYDKLPPLLDLKDIITPKAILYGQIYEKLPGDVPTGLNVHIINDNGEIIYTTTTTEDGFFAFENLPFEKGYTLKLAEPNTKAKIMIFDENKHLVKTISKNKGNDLFYVLLPKAENDVNMLGAKDNSKMLLNDFIGQVYKKLPGDVPSGIEVYLVDDNGKIVMTTYTDATGKFEFNKLPSDKNYTIKFKDSPDASPMQLIALNDKGEKMADLAADAKGNFNYEKLKADWAKMAALSTVDAAMYKTLSGQVYKTIPGDVGEGIDVYLINELGEVVFITKTDASGKFRFTRLPLEANYTVKLKDLKDSEIKLVTYNEKGDKTSEIKKNKSGDFVYVTLGSDK
jgi:hypothetical protein